VRLFVCCKDPEYIGVSKHRLQGEEYGPVPQSTHGVPSSTPCTPSLPTEYPFSTACRCTAQRRRVPTEYPTGPPPAVPRKALPEEDLPCLPPSLPSFLPPSQLHPRRSACRWVAVTPPGGSLGYSRTRQVLRHVRRVHAGGLRAVARRGRPGTDHLIMNTNNDNNNDRNAL
jgi:hypothetical protein